MTEVQRIARDGICVATDPADPGLAATCYAPARQLRTRVQEVWL